MKHINVQVTDEVLKELNLIKKFYSQKFKVNYSQGEALSKLITDEATMINDIVLNEGDIF